MKLKSISILSTSILIGSCSYFNQSTNPDLAKPVSLVCSIQTDSFTIQISETAKTSYYEATNSYFSKPYLGMDCEFISLKELLSVLNDVDSSSIKLHAKELESKFYAVHVDQNIIDDTLDSLVKKKILDMLGLQIHKEMYHIDTTVIALINRQQFLKHSNCEVGDTIKSYYELSNEFIRFDNMHLGDIMARLSEVYNKVIVLKSDEKQRINLKLERLNWAEIEKKLQMELGLKCRTHTTHKEIYLTKN